MASLDFLVLNTDGKTKHKQSSQETVDFLSIKVGASGLEIKETAGHFDMSGKQITNIAAASGTGHAVEYDQHTTALAGKANTSHGHVIGDVTGLQGALDGKSDVGHIHQISGVSGLQDALDGKAAAVHGHAISDVTGLQTALDGKLESSVSGVANGLATLDSGGKVPASQLPNTVMDFKGAWDAGANSPALADGVGNTGDVYRASVSGTQTFNAIEHTWNVGDLIIYNGSVWEFSPAADGISSVNGMTGAVVITKTHVGLSNVDNVQQLPMSYLDTDNTLAANSDTKVPSQKAIKYYVDAAVSGAQNLVAGDGIAISGNTASADYSQTLTNDNAGSITAGQIVYVKSNGNVDLAQATIVGLSDAALGIVKDASIATTASGKVIMRRGAVVGGFTGLTPGMKYYVKRATAGEVALYSAISWQANDEVYSIGRALSATHIIFDPQFEFIY